MRNFLGRFIDNRWFPLVDLLIVLGSGAIWYFRPEYGWKILLIALLPWLARLLAGMAPFRYTPFDFPILIFLITTLVGAQVAYDQSASWAKFSIILVAVLFFYALAGQPRENTLIIVEALTVLGVVISIIFLLVFDWQAHPVKLEVVNRFGKAWMVVRPSLAFPSIRDEDIVSNILLVLTPFPIILLIHGISHRHKNIWPLLVALISIFLFCLGLGMASTMQAIVFACVGLLIVFWWGLSTWLDRKGSGLARKAFFIISGLGLLLALFLLIRFPDNVVNFASDVPLLSRFENRVVVIDNTLHLTKDFLFTGGGLGTFPGLYSLYILDNPNLFILYGSNIFLQMAAEHGVIGSIAYLSIVVGGLFILLQRLYKQDIEENNTYLAYLSMLGFAALLVVGMFDAILYTGLSILVIFIIPGFLVFTLVQSKKNDLSYFYPSTIFITTAFVFLLSLGSRLPATFYANLGAIKMAQLDLTGWTFDQFITPQASDQYGEAVNNFEKALRLDPKNQTSNYRLGLLAYRDVDYQTSGPYLEKAHIADPGNRGIIKKLGYNYVWLGNLDEAEKYLDEIPEAEIELEYFSWWWGTENRNDLSEYANQMVKKLISSQTKGNN
jgi:tetratricopeptide (TPR) repeat protein